MDAPTLVKKRDTSFYNVFLSHAQRHILVRIVSSDEKWILYNNQLAFNTVFVFYIIRSLNTRSKDYSSFIELDDVIEKNRGNKRALCECFG